MQQDHFSFENLDEAIEHLSHIQNILSDTAPKDTLLNIFTSNVSKEDAQKLLKAIEDKLPSVKHVGIAQFRFVGDATRPLILFNLTSSTEAAFHVVQESCMPGGERLAAEKFQEALQNIQHIKGIELFVVNPGLDVNEFLNCLGERYADIPIFGAVAATPVYENHDSFAIGTSLLLNGFTAAVYAGESLQVYMDYILGWKPIGREMVVTLGERSATNECAVRLIDGLPAAHIYKRYLGIEYDADIIENVWAFPLMIRRNNTNICYIPVGTQNGTLYFSGTIYEGEKIRFSYCTRDEILNSALNGSRRMKIFGPEAVFMILCGNRISFLQNEAHLEWDYYKSNHPNLAFCHGFGEIAFQNKKGGLLNSALVAVGMREGKDQHKQETSYSIIPQTQFMPTGKIPLSYLVANFFHEMTKELNQYQEHLEFLVEKKTQENANLSLHVVQTLAHAIDAKDKYTNGHSSRVAKYSVEIARRAGYSQAQLSEMYMISLLHDVGKIGIPDGIINKPARLTDAEYAIIKTHPVVGSAILQEIKEMPKLMTGARWHHERYDGRGYPDGLKGKNIPEEARIIAVADAYDAMTSNRSYRKELAQEIVRAEIEKGKGAQFDPEFADIMLTMIDDDKEYSMKE